MILLHDSRFQLPWEHLESGKDLLDLCFEITLGKTQESAIVVLRPASRAALHTKDSSLNESVNISLGDFSTSQARTGPLGQLWHRDILDSKRSQLCLENGEDIPLGDEEVVNADWLVLSSRGVGQHADHGLGN